MLSNWRNTLKMLGMFVIPAVFLMVVGCSSNSPTGPGDNEGTPSFETPKSMIVQKVTVTSFPSKKSNGDTWDWDPFSSTERKPDIYINLGIKNKSADFRSVTKDNANSGSAYNLTSKAKSSSKSMPYEASYKDSYTFALYDDDGILADDKIGTKDVYIADLYGKDNATNFVKTITCSNGVKVKIEGIWTY